MTRVFEFAAPDFQRTLLWDQAGGLRTTHFVIAATGTDLLARARAQAAFTPEFSFRLDGEPVSSLDPGWALIEESRTDATVTLGLRHARLPIDVEVTYGRGPRRSDKRLAFIYRGDSPATLSHVTVERLPVEIGAPG